MQLKFAVASALAAGLAAFYELAQSWGYLLALSTDLLFVLVSGACSLFALLVVRKWRAGGQLGLVRVGLFLAVFLWFWGELAWAIYEIVFQVLIPYPSLADLFYLGGYAPAALGMLLFLRVFRQIFTGLKALIAALSGLLIVGSTYVFLLNPLIAASTDVLAKVFDVAYPSLDAFLLILAIAMLIVFEGGVMAKSWLWISFALLLTAMADIAFSFGTLTEWYYSGHPVELLWLWGYIRLALGFEGQIRELPTSSRGQVLS